MSDEERLAWIQRREDERRIERAAARGVDAVRAASPHWDLVDQRDAAGGP